MIRYSKNFHALFYRYVVRYVVVYGFLLAFFLVVPAARAQQPVAAIRAIHGPVTVALQGAASVAAAEGMWLQAGDMLEIGDDASVVLMLSEGSELQLGQHTKLDIVELTQHPTTKSRTSRLKLWYGKLIGFLSPGHQEKGSEFTVDTPNATAGLKFSRPVIEVSYDPDTKTSVFTTYTVGITVQNHITDQIEEVPAGSVVTVRDASLDILPGGAGQMPRPQTDLPTPPESSEPTEEPAETLLPPAPSQEPEESSSISPLRSVLMLQGFSINRGATSAVTPVSVGVVGTVEMAGSGGTASTETSSNPNPGTRPDPGTQHVPVTLTLEE